MSLLESIAAKMIWQTTAGNSDSLSFFSKENLLDFIVILLYFILLILLIVLIIWFIQKIYTSQKNISIFPWVNETGDKSYDGFSMGIDDLVMKKLQDIQSQDQSIAPKIEPVRDTISEKGQSRQEGKFRVQMGSVSRYQTGNIQGGQMGNLQTMGKLSLGPIEIPVGFLLSYITRALGGKYIKGYIQRYGSTLKVAVQIETRPSLVNLLTIKLFKKREAKKRFKPRYGTRYVELSIDESSIESVVEDLSHAIYYELSEATLPKNWQVYQHFLKGKKSYREYLERLDHPELLEAAEKEMLEVVQHDPDFVEGQYLMGLIAIYFPERTENALLRFEQVINELKNVEETNAYFQEILLSSYMNMATIYQLIYNDTETASHLIDEALSALKKCPLSVYLAKTDILLNTNRVDEARRILIDSSSKPEDDQEKQWLYETWARIHFQLRQYKDALDYSNKVLEIDPNNLTVRFYRAYISAQSKDFAKAEADYKAVLSYNSRKEHLLYNYIWHALKSNNLPELHAAINRYESIFIGFAYLYKPDFFNPFISAIPVGELEKNILKKLADIVSDQKLTYEQVWKELINQYHSEENLEQEIFLFYGLGVYSFTKSLLPELAEKLPNIAVIFDPPDFSRYYLGFALHYVYLSWVMSQLHSDPTGKFSQLMTGSLPKTVEPMDFVRVQLVKLLIHSLAAEPGFISQFNLLDVYNLIYDFYSFIRINAENVEAVYEEKIEVLNRQIDILKQLGLKEDASTKYVRMADEFEQWARFYPSGNAYYNNLVERAHQALDRAFGLNKFNYEILGRRSLFFYDQANDVEAIRAGEHALERKYNQDWVHYNLGMSYKFVQDFDEAESHFRYAIQFKRQGWNPETIGWDPYLNLAELYREQKNYDQAIKLLQTARRHFPRYHIYSHYLAAFYSLNEQYLEGLNILKSTNLENFNLKHLPQFLKLAEWGLGHNRKFNTVAEIAKCSMKIYTKNNLNDIFLLSHINLLTGWSMYFQSDLDGALQKAQEAEKYLPNHPFMLGLKALIFEKKARFSQTPDQKEEFVATSLEYWKDLYLSTDKHIFKKRAENTLKYYGKLAVDA